RLLRAVPVRAATGEVLDIVERWSPPQTVRNQSAQACAFIGSGGALSWQLCEEQSALTDNVYHMTVARNIQQRHVPGQLLHQLLASRCGADFATAANRCSIGGSLPQKDSLTELLSEAALLPNGSWSTTWSRNYFVGIHKDAATHRKFYFNDSSLDTEVNVTYNASDPNVARQHCVYYDFLNKIFVATDCSSTEEYCRSGGESAHDLLIRQPNIEYNKSQCAYLTIVPENARVMKLEVSDCSNKAAIVCQYNKTSCDSPLAYSLGYLSSTVTYNSSDYIVDLFNGSCASATNQNFAPNSAAFYTCNNINSTFLGNESTLLKSQCRQGASGLSWSALSNAALCRGLRCDANEILVLTCKPGALLTKFDENLHPGSAISNEITCQESEWMYSVATFANSTSVQVCDEKSDGKPSCSGREHRCDLCVKAPRPGYFNIHPTISIACKLWANYSYQYEIINAFNLSSAVNVSSMNQLKDELIGVCNSTEFAQCPRNQTWMNMIGLEILEDLPSQWSSSIDNPQFLAPNASVKVRVYPPGSQVMVNCSAYTNELVSETIVCNDSGSWLLMQNSSGAGDPEFGEHIKCIQYSPCPRNESRLNASGLEILHEEWSEWSNVTDNQQQYLAPNASLIVRCRFPRSSGYYWTGLEQTGTSTAPLTSTRNKLEWKYAALDCNYRVCESVFDQFPPLSTPRGMRTNMSDEWLPFYNASFYPPGSQVLVNCTTIQHLSQIIICNDTGNWVPVQLSKVGDNFSLCFGEQISCSLTPCPRNESWWNDSTLQILEEESSQWSNSTDSLRFLAPNASIKVSCRLPWTAGLYSAGLEQTGTLRCPLSTATTNRLTWEDSALSCSDRVCPPVFDQLPQFSVATGLKLNQSAEWQPYFNSSIYPPGSQVMVNCTTDEQVSEIIFCNSTGDWTRHRPARHDIRPARHDIRPARHDIRPARHDIQPARHDIQADTTSSPPDTVISTLVSEVETIADGTITRNETTITETQNSASVELVSTTDSYSTIFNPITQSATSESSNTIWSGKCMTDIRSSLRY
uniref:Sushi domain-containing protein n=1 Tax=Macrostomum lignano TaxID=282301 RepID=A0A1I8F396_9PLAT